MGRGRHGDCQLPQDSMKNKMITTAVRTATIDDKCRSSQTYLASLVPTFFRILCLGYLINDLVVEATKNTKKYQKNTRKTSLISAKMVFLHKIMLRGPKTVKKETQVRLK